MQNPSTQMVHHLLLLFFVIIATGMISGKIAHLLRLPDVVLFILAGMVVGQGMNLVNETSSSLTNQLVLTLGSAFILFDGGRHIGLKGLKRVSWTVGLLSVPGVLITAAVTGAAIHYLFGIDWLYALLAASVIASTDPASIIPVFRQVKIRDKVRETVESESAFNDATASILTFALLAAVTGEHALEAGPMIWQFIRTALGGILLGLVCSLIVVYLAANKRFPLLKDYTSVAMLSVAIGAYLFGELLHVSGFMATFVAGLIWGNSHLFGLHMTRKMDELAHFSDNITVIMRMLIFVLLGSQVDFKLLAAYWWQSLIVELVLIALARPITVFACALPDRKAGWTVRELLFMVWVRETGVIPAALSGMIAGMGIEHAKVIAAVTFMAIMITILVQASTTTWVARKLGLEA